ncbi:hypothetical protein K8942_05290 [Candidatus Peribacteria bacterium]|nr:MAG: hypothetical protein K8942_05290 [Candidatus Peribacteria bacterium]
MENPGSSDSVVLALSSLRRKGNSIVRDLEELQEMREMYEMDGEGVPGFVKQNIRTLLQKISLFSERVESQEISSLCANNAVHQRIFEQIIRIASIIQASVGLLDVILSLPDSRDDDDDCDDNDDRDRDDDPRPSPSSPQSRILTIHDIAV